MSRTVADLKNNIRRLKVFRENAEFDLEHSDWEMGATYRQKIREYDLQIYSFEEELKTMPRPEGMFDDN